MHLGEMQPKLECFVSAVVPLADDADIVEAAVRELVAVLSKNYTHYEVILIDDGSTDETVTIIDRLLREVECLRLVRLSRRFGQEIAISAGLEGAIGDFTVVLLPDSDPPELIPQMIRRAREGAGCVFGIRQGNAVRSWWKTAGWNFFSRYCKKFLHLEMPAGMTHFRVLSRKTVNAITQVKDRTRYLRTLSAYVGFANQGFEYELRHRRGIPREKSFFESVGLAVNIIIANSLHPLRFASLLSIGLFIWNFAYLSWIFGVHVVKRNVAEGWTTQAIEQGVMFGGVFLVLAVLCEYTGRILEESRHRPLYHLLEERQSNILVTRPDRQNVVTDSSSHHA